MSDITKVKSITNAVLNNGKAVTKKDLGKSDMISLGKITGAVTGCFSVNTKFGENIGFKGDFYAVTKDGSFVESEAVFLPKQATEEIIAKVRENNSPENEILIDIEIKVTTSDKNEKGIAFIADAPETQARKNRRAELLERLQQNALTD